MENADTNPAPPYPENGPQFAHPDQTKPLNKMMRFLMKPRTKISAPKRGNVSVRHKKVKYY